MASVVLHGGPNATVFPNYGFYRSRRRNRSPSHQHQDQVRRDRSTLARVPAENLIMGQVKILKRGEPLTAFLGGKGSGIAAEDRDLDLGLGSTSRLGPDPLMVQKQIRFPEGHAGSAVFVNSPPPSSVPVPCFLAKSGTATSDLRRLLRLNLP